MSVQGQNAKPPFSGLSQLPPAADVAIRWSSEQRGPALPTARHFKNRIFARATAAACGAALWSFLPSRPCRATTGLWLSEERRAGQIPRPVAGDGVAPLVLFLPDRWKGARHGAFQPFEQHAIDPVAGFFRDHDAGATTNVGADKDSEKRQRAAIEGYARGAGLEVVDWFYDPAVSGADPIETRPGFSALLDRIEGNGVRAVLIEDAGRFARDLIAQELGILLLIKRGVRLLTASGDDLCDTSDPSRVMMRQIAGAFAQYEKARLVARLRRAREVKGKLGGRKGMDKTRPELVALARQLRTTRSGRQRSLREISHELAARGFLTAKTGKPFVAAQVANMLRGMKED
jgi:DNA invertase Pin-like site-specific DNA recombinase